MTHVTCNLTAKNWDQLRNATPSNQVWATCTFTVGKHALDVNISYYYVLTVTDCTFVIWLMLSGINSMLHGAAFSRAQITAFGG